MREAGEAAEPAEAPEPAGVHAVVRRLEEPAVASAVPVRPYHRLGGTEASGADPSHHAGELFGAAAVLPFVTPGEEVPAHLEAGGEGSVRAEERGSGSHVGLRRRGDDDDVVPLPAVPFEAIPGVGAQPSPQVHLCELRTDALELRGGAAGEQPHEQHLFRVIRGGPAHDRRMQEPRKRPEDRERDGNETADLDEERQHAASVGEGAVEIERGDGRRGAGVHRGV